MRASKGKAQPAKGAKIPDPKPAPSFVWDPALRDSIRKRAQRLYAIGELAAAARLLTASE